MENRIRTSIPENIASEVLLKIKEAGDLIAPYITPLSVDERRALPKMGDGTSPFVKKCLEYSQANPKFVPAYLNVDDFKSDMDTWEQLLGMLRPVQQLYQNLNDTTLEAGSESYTAALSVYNAVKDAAKRGVADSKPIYDDLKERFAKSKRKSPNAG